ncbi:MAG: FecR domain-containing protein [Bacteroidota bacterium]|nr:FecR domain-containing protein [Bacteroidota bacterium]
MLENNKQDFTKKVIDFLVDDLFLLWRINPTRELNEYWDNFIRKNPQLENQFRQAITEIDQIRSKSHSLSQAQLQVKEKIEYRLLSYKNRKKRIVYYVSAAAAIALLLIISTLFILNQSDYRTEKIMVLGNTVQDNEIQLFTGDEVVNLNNNSTLNMSESGNSVIIQDSMSQKEIKLQDHTINKLIIPYGKRSSLILADGSKVWLNSGTEIEFPSVFASKTREIKVKGEIYIEVSKRKEPFIVHTFNSQIQVFGTSFNVSAYEDEERESVVLVEGSIQVKSNANNASLILSPGQMAEISAGNIKSKEVDVSEYIGWKDGFMQFNKVPLDEVLRKVGRYYNVEFRYNEEIDLLGKTCSGKLFLSENIDDVLQSFTNITLLNYEKQSDHIIYIIKER